jgi:hypothetical protein
LACKSHRRKDSAQTLAAAEEIRTRFPCSRRSLARSFALSLRHPPHCAMADYYNASSEDEYDRLNRIVVRTPSLPIAAKDRTLMGWRRNTIPMTLIPGKRLCAVSRLPRVASIAPPRSRPLPTCAVSTIVFSPASPCSLAIGRNLPTLSTPSREQRPLKWYYHHTHAPQLSALLSLFRELMM